MLGGKLLVTSDCIFNNETYINDFKQRCILLTNMQSCKFNIKNHDGKIIHFYNNDVKTYRINDNNLEIDEFPINEEDIDNINILKNYNLYFNKNLKINEYEIPLLFLYINNYEIFNFFILYIDFINNKDYLDLIKIIFNKNKITNTFINLSYNFNIFNISLFNNVFFDIVYIILYIITNIDKIPKNDLLIFIKLKIQEIFNNKKNLINLYDLTLYIKSNLLNTQDITIKKLKETNIKKKEVAKIHYKRNILENEYFANIKFTDDEIDIKYNSIIDIIINQIYLISEMLFQITTLFNNFNDFPKIFLFAILSYRLNNKYILGTWAFNSFYINKYINENLLVNLELENLKLTNFKKLFIYLDIPSYSQIKYNNIIFSNCMEHTIFQFIKIIFWDIDNFNFNTEIIKKIIKKKYVDKIIFFLEKSLLGQEHHPIFCNDWIDFIILIHTNSNYNLLFKQPELNIELYAQISNLIIFCKELFNLELKNNKTILNNIVKNINSKYNVNITYDDSDDEKNSDNYGTINLLLYQNIDIIIYEGHADIKINNINKITDDINYDNINKQIIISQNKLLYYYNFNLYYLLQNIINVNLIEYTTKLINSNIINNLTWDTFLFKISKLIIFQKDFIIYLSKYNNFHKLIYDFIDNDMYLFWKWDIIFNEILNLSDKNEINTIWLFLLSNEIFSFKFLTNNIIIQILSNKLTITFWTPEIWEYFINTYLHKFNNWNNDIFNIFLQDYILGKWTNKIWISFISIPNIFDNLNYNTYYNLINISPFFTFFKWTDETYQIFFNNKIIFEKWTHIDIWKQYFKIFKLIISTLSDLTWQIFFNNENIFLTWDNDLWITFIKILKDTLIHFSNETWIIFISNPNFFKKWKLTTWDYFIKCNYEYIEQNKHLLNVNKLFNAVYNNYSNIKNKYLKYKNKYLKYKNIY